MYHDEMTASAAPTTGSPKERHELAVADTWKLDDIYASAAGVGGGLRRARGRHPGRWPPAAARWPRAPTRCSPRSRIATRSASWPIASTTSPRSTTTRTSATTPPTAAASACSTCSRSGARRRRGSTPSCSRFRSTTVQGWMQRVRGARALPLLDRGSLPPAGARPRRGGGAAAGAVGAVRPRRRRQPTTRSPPPTRRSRPSRCRPARR